MEISRKNITRNIKSLKSLLRPDTLFMAVVKSNAYGHGLKEVSKICVQYKGGDPADSGVNWFGVDNIDEALILRKQGINQPILILGYIPFDRVNEAMENDISFVAYNIELLDYLAGQKFKKSAKAKIHIKVETGVSRQGIAGEELMAFVKKAAETKSIYIEGIYTHYANIEDTADPSYAMEQLGRFAKEVAAAEKIVKIPLKHSACSAAFINYPETHFNMVRAGISLYGMWPSSETKAVALQKNIDLTLKPAIIWKTQIAQIKKLPAGTPISYGLTEMLKRDSIVGILPIGYWDGYDRGLSGIGEVLINGKRAKILGRVCMNMTIIDLTDIADANLFNGVILLGPDGQDSITAEEIAKKINTINYEITTRINPLIKRIVK